MFMGFNGGRVTDPWHAQLHSRRGADIVGYRVELQRCVHYHQN